MAREFPTGCRDIHPHETNRIPATSTLSYTQSGKQRSVLFRRQFEWQTIVATWNQRGKSNVVDG